METMFQYINETPLQCRENIQNSKELTKPVVEAFCKKDYKRIEIIASGSSYNASMTAKYFIEKILTLKVEVLSSYTACHCETIFEDDTFYLGIGQSGRSTNTNDAMKKVRENGQIVVGLTGNTESVMKDHCDVICNWGMGIEKIGFVTKGYSTAVLFYMLFALEAAREKKIIKQDEYDNYIQEMFKMCDVMEKAIPVVDGWYAANAFELYDFNRVQVLGYGSGYGLALEGALKIQETMGVASSAHEIEEFLHGPCYELNPEKSVIIIDISGDSKDRVLKLYHELHTLTPKIFLVTNCSMDDKRVLTIEHDLDEYMSVLVNAIALQTIGAHGREKWINPILDKRIAFCEAMNTKSPKTGKEVGL